VNEVDRPAVLENITAIIRKELPRATGVLDATTTAADVPGWDSLAHVSIILAVERAFRFRIRATEMARLDNLGALVDVVIARGTARETAR
jgi:acyl carrier protein